MVAAQYRGWEGDPTIRVATASRNDGNACTQSATCSTLKAAGEDRRRDPVSSSKCKCLLGIMSRKIFFHTT
jgi:hypothetical protein